MSANEELQREMAKYDPLIEYRKKVDALSREEKLEIIGQQNPKYIGQIRRIEYVFQSLLRHLNWEDGTPITERNLTDQELSSLIDPPFIHSKELAKFGYSEEQQRALHIANDPVLWGRHFLNLKPRVYQTLVLRNPSKRKVMRFGRRMGKTYTMALLILWYAYTNKNARILVIAPMKTHVGLIYDEVHKMLERNKAIEKSVVRSVTSPQYEINFDNGSLIRFFTSGMKSNAKADVARGQDADLIILDEMDYMGPDDLVALMAMLQKTDEEKTTEKALVAASTPTGLRNTFWKWNTDKKSGYTPFWFPSYANPLWTTETEEEMRQQYPKEQDYRHEVEADWGEAVDGVYPRVYIDRAQVVPGWEYRASPAVVNPESIYVMGVDWDKVGAGVNLVILELCGPGYMDEQFQNKVKLIYRAEIPKGDFTYTNAVDEIVRLDAIFNCSYIYVDRGAGEMQIEYLHKYGIDHPNTKMHTKVKGFQFSQNVEVKDPFTKKPEKKEVKAFMVDNLYRMIQDEKIKFSEDDDEMYFQLISYVVLRQSAYGKPIFGPAGGAADHAHDALILACLAVSQNYDDLLKVKYETRSRTIGSEVFSTLLSAETSKDDEIIKDTWGDKKNAPVRVQRSMTANVRSSGPGKIKRKMF